MKQARLQKRLAVAATLAVAGCAAFLLQQEARPEQRPAAAPAQAMQAVPALLPVAAQLSPAPARRVYPYSIVPGGVTSRTELARAVLADKVVAAHYAGFDVDKAELRTVPKARAVYVSYRKGGQVYWTAKKVMLAEGEAVLSDGQSDIRARCGNRISDTPQLPVEVKGPSEQELDTPVEQTQVAEDGALREVAFDPDDDDEGEGQSFVAQSFPNGAGLLTTTQARASASQGRFSQAGLRGGSLGQGDLDALAGDERKRALLAMLSSSASGLGGKTPNGGAANGGATNGGAADTSGGSNPGGGGAPGGPGGKDEGAPDPAGSDGGSGNAGGSGGKGDSGGGKPADPTLRPDPLPDPLPDRGNPPKDHELPEPGSLWLAGMAAAALLLQRRLRRR